MFFYSRYIILTQKSKQKQKKRKNLRQKRELFEFSDLNLTRDSNDSWYSITKVEHALKPLCGRCLIALAIFVTSRAVLNSALFHLNIWFSLLFYHLAIEVKTRVKIYQSFLLTSTSFRRKKPHFHIFKNKELTSNWPLIH